VFRRRRRDGGDGAGPEPGAGEYGFDDDELTEPADQVIGDDEGDVADDEDFGVADYDGGEHPIGLAAEPQEPDEADELDQPAAASKPARDDLGDPATWTKLRDTSPTAPAMERSAGPWDSAGGYPDADRMNFGSLLVPVRDGFDVQIFVSEEQGVSIAVVNGDSGVQLQPFAAPRSSGLWHEVLPEIADEVANAGGESSAQDGPFGPELFAMVSPQLPGEPPVPPQPLRFIGADGPRWFLRGLITGPAATDRELGRPFEEIFADVVVVRGDHAVPQRSPLEITLPDEAREALESQLEEQDARLVNPYERGPEITETR
jgi:Protein of unknown function (DUF3710)